MECEPWEIELDYEMDKILDASSKHLLNICPECGSVIHGNFCDTCNKTVPTERYYDPDFDSYFNQVESLGRDIPSIEETLKKPDDWEEV